MVITSNVVQSLTPSLVRQASRFMRRADAEDVVQETWLSAVQCSHSVRDATALRAWLRAILRRRIVDQRRKARHRVLADGEVEIPCEDDPGVHSDLAAALPHIADGLSQLTALERQAVYLIDVNDMDRDEAAAQLQVSRGHLRVLLHRGRGQLAKHLTRSGVHRA